MIPGLISSSDTQGLKRMIDLSDLRHKFIANNVANLKTPGYSARDVSFNQLLRHARDTEFNHGMETTHPTHFPQGGPGNKSPFHLSDEFLGLYVHRVNRSEEEEMSTLAMNSMTYRSAADILARKYRMISNAISGGK